MMRYGYLLVCALNLAFVPATLRAAEPSPQQLAFFEAKIRPILVEHCYACHSAEAENKNKLKGGLLLDTKAGTLTGGDSGPALVVGKPGESLLLKTLKYDGDLRMPPKGKLSDSVIADFETWIKSGAADPREGTQQKKQIGMSLEAGRQFWAYKPIASPTPPTVKNSAWVKNPVDAFILHKLEAANATPAKDAEPHVWARRVYFDLIGLPPTPAQIDTFLAAFAKNPTVAREQLVDELLASPRFGERWGRHWLDIARYAESVTLRGFIMNQTWRYRDYVIESFNTDVPFDRFIREQLAGDLLPAANPDERTRNLVATTYLAMGNTNLEEQDKKQLRMDYVDEQLDVISKGFLAQTVTCARCHDHKFDPIPTKDYYALAGILRNTKAMEHSNVSKWVEVPLPLPAAQERAMAEAEKSRVAIEAQIKKLKGLAKGKGAVKAILKPTEITGVVVDDEQAKKVGTWQQSTHSGNYIGVGYTHDQADGKGEKTITFQPDLPANGKYEVRLAYSVGTNRATNVPVTVFSADGEKTTTIDMTKPPPIDGRFISLGEYQFEKAGQSFVIVSNEDTKGHVTADAVVFINATLTPPKPTNDKATDDLKKLEAELKKLQEAAAKRPTVITVVEEKTIEDARIHIRGLVSNQGAVAPRGFLQVATHGPMPTLPKNQSGRLELAEWIASQHNPLTARVMANRVWHWLFGSGLVRTVDNFGVTGETPSHPELLDHLATHFIEQQWSVKKLLRTLVLSHTYQLASVGGAPNDAENRLFSRANRKRLEAEAIRDAILSISGELNLNGGGQTYSASLSSDYNYKGSDTRRSVYLPVFRNSIPDELGVFDFADSSMVTGKRNTSTVAPQALYLLNHPFPIEQAKLAAKRAIGTSDEAITLAYRVTLGREPTASERAIVTNHVAKTNDWASVYHSLFASAAFRFVD